MLKLKKHIGWIFLWVFLVPQFNNVLHYWVIKHDFSRELNTKPLVSNKSQIHYCDQTLFKIPSMLLLIQNYELYSDVSVYRQQLGEVFEKFPEVYFIGYYLRGPPVVNQLQLII